MSNKQKNKKSLSKRVKITSSGKVLRRHQLGSGHLRRNKSKQALNRHKKTMVFFKGETRKIIKMLGL